MSEAFSPGHDSNDREFEPTADMMVHDFDDERTLDEEEAMEAGDDVRNELSSLQKEQDMPLEDLLALYGYKGEETTQHSTSSEEILSNQDLTLDKDEIARDLLGEEASKRNRDETSKSSSCLQNLLDNSMNSTNSSTGTSRLLRSVSRQQSEEDEEEEDYDYSPDEDDEWRKTIMVGSTYQASIPDELCKYDDALPYENDDKLMWDPYFVNSKDVDNYLLEVQKIHNENSGTNICQNQGQIRDDEQALYLLLQCNYNTEEALRRKRMSSNATISMMSLWSEEECESFESGLRTYGKDFYQIQENKVRTRSVGELIEFYYYWKKTQRHDIFTNKTRLEKKKYALHPGTTDFMERFLDEQDGSNNNHRERSSSPNVNSLIYGDPKRHRGFEVNRLPSDTQYNTPCAQPDLTTSQIEDLARQLDNDSLDKLVKLASDNPDLSCVVTTQTSATESLHSLLRSSGKRDSIKNLEMSITGTQVSNSSLTRLNTDSISITAVQQPAESLAQ